MSGKIFKDSANIFQDQAKILFEYYKNAAEKIVAEEERLEKEISIQTEIKTQKEAEASSQYQKRNILLILGGVLAVAGVVLFILMTAKPVFGIMGLVAGLGSLIFGFVTHKKGNEVDLEIEAALERIKGFTEAHEAIFRDYKVTKLGVGYVPVAGSIPFEDKSFMIDYTGTKENENFRLQTVKQGELFSDKVEELEQLIQEIPIVENSSEVEEVDTSQYSKSIQKVVYHDYFGQLDRNLRTSAFCMNDLVVNEVALPVIVPGSDYANFISEYATTDVGNSPVFETFDVNRFNDEIEHFNSLNELKKSLERDTQQFEEVLTKLMLNMANSVQAVTKLKISSANNMVLKANALLYKMLKSAYNHYSPALEAEEIDRIKNEKFDFSESVESYTPFQLKQSSRVRYDLISDCWSAEDGTKTNFPFGVHQIHEEIVAPIVQSLLMETRIERLKIYNNIKDQKINYLNKWHQDTEDFYGRNRAESNDLINQMRSTLSEYIAAYNTLTALETTEKSMKENASLASTVVSSKDNSAEVFATFDFKSKEFQSIQQEFIDYMDRLKEDIERRAEKFEHIEFYDASLRDSYPKNMAVSTSHLHEIEERRKPLTAVNPLFAESADLPPEPSMEDSAYENLSVDLNRLAAVAAQEINSYEYGQTQNQAVNYMVEPGITAPATPAPDATSETIDDAFDTSLPVDETENEQDDENDVLNDIDDEIADEEYESEEEEEIEEEEEEEEEDEDNNWTFVYESQYPDEIETIVNALDGIGIEAKVEKVEGEEFSLILVRKVDSREAKEFIENMEEEDE